VHTPAWIVVVALLVAVAALAVSAVALVVVRRRGQATTLAPAPDHVVASPPSEPVYAFVLNPSKPAASELRGQIDAIFAARGLREALWFETTLEDAGQGAAHEALVAGADVVVAVGGDGTVRAVAETLAGSGSTMGVLPLGTGNLLARNLDIDVNDVNAALETVLGPHARRIDVGRVRLLGGEHDAPGHENEDDSQVFLVIGGMGFDAAMVADTRSSLKARLGWLAYFMAGARHLHARRIELGITIDDRPEVRAKLRTLLVGNCGRLPGGLTLLPSAQIDDGILDLAAVDTRGGVVGWVQLFGEVLMQGIGIRNDLPNKIGRIDHTTGTHVVVRASQPQQVQIDGEVLGEAAGLEAWVDPAALTVRAPAPRLVAHR